MADPISAAGIGWLYFMFGAQATALGWGLGVASKIYFKEPESESSRHVPYYYDDGEEVYSDDENRPKILIIPNKAKNENTMNINTDNPRTRSQTRSVNTDSD
jgi:hypothetical protein